MDQRHEIPGDLQAAARASAEAISRRLLYERPEQRFIVGMEINTVAAIVQLALERVPPKQAFVDLVARVAEAEHWLRHTEAFDRAEDLVRHDERYEAARRAVRDQA